MRRFWIVPAALALATLAIADGKKDKGPKVPDGYAWEQSYDMAKLKAAEQGKLFFLDFYTES